MEYLYKAFVDVLIEIKTMDAMNNFKISLSFCLLEYVMVVASFEAHSQIKGKFYKWIVLYREIYKNNISEANMKFGLIYLSAEFRYKLLMSCVRIFFNVNKTNSQKRFKDMFNCFMEFNLFFCTRYNWVLAQVLNSFWGFFFWSILTFYKHLCFSIHIDGKLKLYIRM